MNNKMGYVIAVADGSDFYIPDALHIERIDELNIFESDREAARTAEKDGIKLIYGMDGIPDGTYLDTKENRKKITEVLSKFPEYYNVHVKQ